MLLIILFDLLRFAPSSIVLLTFPGYQYLRGRAQAYVMASLGYDAIVPNPWDLAGDGAVNAFAAYAEALQNNSSTSLLFANIFNKQVGDIKRGVSFHIKFCFYLSKEIH